MATIQDHEARAGLYGTHGITRDAIDAVRRIIDTHPDLDDDTRAMLRSRLVPDDVIVAPETVYSASRRSRPHRRRHHASGARAAL